jgi:hypothetical protein
MLSDRVKDKAKAGSPKKTSKFFAYAMEVVEIRV